MGVLRRVDRPMTTAGPDRGAAAIVVVAPEADPATLLPVVARFPALAEAGIAAAAVVMSVDAALVAAARPATATAAGIWLATAAGVVLAVGPSAVTEAAVADPVTWLVAALADRGVGPGLVLVAGPAASAGGQVAPRVRVIDVEVAALPGLIDDQRRRALAGRPPDIDDDPDWVVSVEDLDPGRERQRECILTVADGRFGSRGVREDGGDAGDPMVVAAGVYDHGPRHPDLQPGPLWMLVDALPDGAPDRWRLDLRTGVLVHTRGEPPVLRSVRFASLARPGTAVLHLEGAGSALDPGAALRPPAGANGAAAHDAGAGVAALAAGGRPGSIVSAALTRDAVVDGHRTVERIVFQHGRTTGSPDLADAVAPLRAVAAVGAPRLLAEQRRAWAQRWAAAQVDIEGAPDDQLAARFALFHLMANVHDGEEAAVGARGLTGRAYAGHVFWDADVYVLPFLAATHPPAARAMLRYRANRLDAARRHAAATHARGARFPWESADTGEDVTPRTWRSPDGASVPIQTGPHEEHIVSDVAWAAMHDAAWTGDRSFLLGEGRGLVVEAARYWESRLREDVDGRLHLYGVVGPDEYHEVVDDSAYTNVMARWTLRAAADLVTDGDPGAPEPARWRAQADRIVDGYDATTGVYEQFAGYHRLEPLHVADVATPPFAADVTLGPARVKRTQIIKQADVVLLHHLVPDEVAPGSLAANLDHYLPRTAHGSSLSPAVYAALLARCGRADEALPLLRLALRLDLDDLTGTAAGGIHLAAYGGAWQALAYGFLGLWPTPEALRVAPAPLPTGWSALGLRVTYQGRRLRLRSTGRELALTTDGPVGVVVGGRRIDVSPPRMLLERTSDGWKEGG